MPSTTTLDELQAAAVKALRSWYNRGDKKSSNDLRTVAESVVPARSHFYDKSGRPDWRGTSNLYRRWLRETFSLAGIAAADVSKTSSALRYHIGMVLRETLDVEDLEEFGLLPEGPRERNSSAVQRYRNMTAIFSSGGAEIADAETMVLAADGARTAFARIRPEAVQALPDADRREVAAAMRTVRDLADRILFAAQ